MEQTANYHLSQWKGEERILVEDLNTGNAKVDAALKACRRGRDPGPNRGSVLPERRRGQAG